MLIQPGLRIFADNVGRDLSIGPIAVQGDGDDLFALVPGAFFLADDSLEVGGAPIGTVVGVDVAAWGERGMPIAAALKPVRLHQNVEVAPIEHTVADGPPSLGARVTRDVGSARAAKGTIAAVDTPMFIKRGDGTKQIYRGAFSIRGENGPFAVAGDGGTLVMDDAGDVLGMIVAVAEDLAYAVPISAAMQTFGLRTADDDAIRSHNARAKFVEEEERKRASAPPDLSLVVAYDEMLALLYGAAEFKSAFANLDRMGLDHLQVFRKASVYDQFQRAMLEVPRLDFKTISATIAERPELLTATIHRTAMTQARVNFLVGVQDHLPKTRSERSDYAMRILKAHARHGLKHDALEVIGDLAEHLSPVAFRMAATGLPVSLETASLTIIVLLDMAKAEGSTDKFRGSFLEPALYVLDDGADDLLRHLMGRGREQNEFLEVFAAVSASIPHFPRYSGLKLLADVCVHRPVRYATAWVLQRAVAEFAGRGFKWRSAMNKRGEMEVASIEHKSLSAAE
ncbi:hypothetical protein SAMN05216456_1465 [Devosia crocina]|uniref:Uncharacterized protein n=1 Tax=Devosia crocina TaxID=429728 RepID=A0A1I7NAY2_9HYPH|nr:hypothetical protein [Devosia crocina]SFV31809.1 hypothetical protein SAMN05216456_1465 [Devosia crocina]